MILERHPVSRHWVFRAGKYRGETIEQVAVSNSDYVRWAWSQNDLTDEAFYALSDCMDRFDIPRTKPHRTKEV